MKWLKIATKIWNKLDWIKLYWEDKYKFLEKHKDVLWENPSLNDIVWEWTQALILKHPTNERLVVKVAKEWNVDDIVQEFNNHKLFYDTWKKWIKEWEIPENVRIPSVKEWKTNWSFFMEKIEWQSLYSKTFINRFENQLSKEDLAIITSLNDKQVREFLKERLENVNDDSLDRIINDYSIEYMLDELWLSRSYKKSIEKLEIHL